MEVTHATFPEISIRDRIRRENLNVANLLTMIRLLCVPVVAVMLYSEGFRPLSYGASLWVFAIYATASLTDFVDGYIARRFNQITRLGQLLDPLADKLMVTTALIMMVPLGYVPAWMACVITAREVAITGLRGAAVDDGVVIPASQLGKLKSLFLSLGTGFVMVHHPVLGLNNPLIGKYLLWIGTALTLWSGVDYFCSFVSKVFAKDAE